MIENNSDAQPGHVLFPWRLREMLDECENEGKSDIVSWLPDGKAFKVHNVSVFVSTILPSYFKQTKYKSFQRQLNLWGFERITRAGTEKGAYFHQKFLKSQPDLCRFLKRERANTKKANAARKLMTTKAPIQSEKEIFESKESEVYVSDEEITFTTSFRCTELPSIKPLDTYDFEPQPNLIQDQYISIPEDQDNFLNQEFLEPIQSFEGNIFFPLEANPVSDLHIEDQVFGTNRVNDWDFTFENDQLFSGQGTQPSQSMSHAPMNLCAV